MQQHPPLTKVDISTLYCGNNNPVRYFCVMETCQSCALCCGLPNCESCEKLHADCDFASVERLINRIQKKKSNPSEDLEKGFAAIQKMYDDAIDMLSEERDHLFLVKQNYGLNAGEVQFIQFVNAINREELTGQFISKVKLLSKEPSRETVITEEDVKQFWKKEQVKIQSFLKSISGLINYQFGKFAKAKDDFDWDAAHKPNCVTLAGKTVTQTQNYSQERFAMMNNRMISTRPYMWGLTIPRFASWIGIGICLRNKIGHEKAYQFQDSNIGHGAYMISSNGYSWSHEIQAENNCSKAFSFSTNDKIFIRFDPKAHKLIFVKNKKEGRFEMTVNDAPSGDQYVPCANVLTTGDSVQIIELDSEISWEEQ